MKLRLSSAGIGHLLAIACTFVWSTTFIVNKMLFNDDLDPLLVILLRQTLACLLVTLTCALCMRRRPPIHGRIPLKERLSRDRLLIIAGILGIFIYYLFDNYSVKNTYVTNSSLLMTTAPIFAALIDRYIIKDSHRFTLSFSLGTLCCFLGAFLIIFNGSFMLKLSPLGDLLAIGAAVIWAVYCTLVKVVSLENARRERPRSQAEIARAFLCWGSLAMWIFYLSSGGDFSDLAGYSGRQLGMIAFLGVVASFLCLLFWNGSIARIGAVKCSLYLFASPLLAILASAVFLDERLSLVSGLGAAALLLGMALAQGFLDRFLHILRKADASG